VVIDRQLASRHLESLGSRSIPRPRFQALLREHAMPIARPLGPTVPHPLGEPHTG